MPRERRRIKQEKRRIRSSWATLMQIHDLVRNFCIFDVTDSNGIFK